MEFDFTAWWVPATAILVLGSFIILSAVREARLPPLPAASAPAATAEAGDGSSGEAAPSGKKDAKAEPQEKGRGFLVRTSWIWGSLLIGAGAQAYLTYVAAN